jgi:thermostable 8-oxoguanine DNA glycosylase
MLGEIKQEFGNSVNVPTGDPRESVLAQIRTYRNNSSESIVRELAERLNLNEKNETMKRLRSVLLQNRGGDVGQVVEQIKNEFSTVSSRTVEQSRETISKLIERFRQNTQSESRNRSTVQNLKNLADNQLSNLLKNMGFEPDKELLRTARRVLQADPSPTQENLKTVLENVQLARGGDGSSDSDRLRALLFLVKNDLPVKEETVDLLRPSAPGNASTERSRTTNLLQNLTSTANNSSEQLSESLRNALQATQVSPASGDSSESLAARLADAVRSMGFDLEKQVGKNSDRARKSLRSQMMAFQQNLTDQLSQTLLQGQSGDSSSRDPSRTFLSQLMKHSLASVADDDSIFLFVPFPDKEGTGLMRMRFEDDGEGDEVDDDRARPADTTTARPKHHRRTKRRVIDR